MIQRSHAPLAPIFKCLFEPHQYKVMYGGRGGGKSWSVARALIIIAAQRKVRVLCCRQTMQSIRDSSHQLLHDQIVMLGLESKFNIQEKVIICPSTGSEFIFKGLAYNVQEIKSTEGVDICWVEEANFVSKASWTYLVPTIRKPKSEIWITFNPDLAEDDTFQRWVLKPPPTAVVQKVGWQDNPWFPQELHKQRLHLLETNPDEYQNVWEGACRASVIGAIYEIEIGKADAEGRVCRLTHDPTRPVHTAWDLGFGDKTSVWVWQQVGTEVRLLDYLEDERKAIDHYVRELQKLPYTWGTDYMPWDAQGGQANLTGKSIADFARSLGRKVVVLPQVKSKSVRINATRVSFPMFWFNGEKCGDGIQALRHYEWAKREDKVSGRFEALREPKHNWASHAADALSAIAMALQTPKPQAVAKKAYTPRPVAGAMWA